MHDMTDNGIAEAYHKWYYDTRVWDRTTFMGLICHKSVSDMWNYQEILAEVKPTLVVEFGTCKGGSILFFSTILKMLNPVSKAFTVDITHAGLSPLITANPHIELMTCSSTDRRVQERIKALREEYPGKVFAILDSDHKKAHVLAEMELFRPLLRSGDYLVVEDSNINGHPVRPGWGEGPMEAILEYFDKYPYDYDNDLARERKFGFTFSPRGFLIKK